jgi:hypothetical protein
MLYTTIHNYKNYEVNVDKETKKVIVNGEESQDVHFFTESNKIAARLPQNSKLMVLINTRDCTRI